MRGFKATEVQQGSFSNKCGFKATVVLHQGLLVFSNIQHATCNMRGSKATCAAAGIILHIHIQLYQYIVF